MQVVVAVQVWQGSNGVVAVQIGQASSQTSLCLLARRTTEIRATMALRNGPKKSSERTTDNHKDI